MNIIEKCNLLLEAVRDMETTFVDPQTPHTDELQDAGYENFPLSHDFLKKVVNNHEIFLPSYLNQFNGDMDAFKKHVKDNGYIAGPYTKDNINYQNFFRARYPKLFKTPHPYSGRIQHGAEQADWIYPHLDDESRSGSKEYDDLEDAGVFDYIAKNHANYEKKLQSYIKNKNNKWIDHHLNNFLPKPEINKDGIKYHWPKTLEQFWHPEAIDDRKINLADNLLRDKNAWELAEPLLQAATNAANDTQSYKKTQHADIKNNIGTILQWHLNRQNVTPLNDALLQMSYVPTGTATLPQKGHDVALAKTTKRIMNHLINNEALHPDIRSMLKTDSTLYFPQHPDFLHSLTKSSVYPYDQSNAAQHPNLHKKTVQDLLNFNNNIISKHLAANESIPKNELKKLIKNTNQDVLMALSRRQDFDAGDLNEIHNTNKKNLNVTDVYSALLNRKELHPITIDDMAKYVLHDTLQDLSGYNREKVNLNILTKLLMHNNAHEKTINNILDQGDARLAAIVAAKKKITNNIFDKIKGLHGDKFYQYFLDNPSTPTTAINKIAKDGNAYIYKHAILNHPNTDENVLNALADSNEEKTLLDILQHRAITPKIKLKIKNKLQALKSI